jgi:hypothetical protein
VVSEMLKNNCVNVVVKVEDGENDNEEDGDDLEPDEDSEVDIVNEIDEEFFIVKREDSDELV